MPVLSRAAEAQARLAAARSATADAQVCLRSRLACGGCEQMTANKKLPCVFAQRSQVERLEELDRRMEGPCASSEEDDETLEQYLHHPAILAVLLVPYPRVI